LTFQLFLIFLISSPPRAHFQHQVLGNRETHFSMISQKIYSKKLMILRFAYFDGLGPEKSSPGGDKTMKIVKNLKLDFLRLFAPKARPLYGSPEKSTSAGGQKPEKPKKSTF